MNLCWRFSPSISMSKGGSTSLYFCDKERSFSSPPPPPLLLRLFAFGTTNFVFVCRLDLLQQLLAMTGKVNAVVVPSNANANTHTSTNPQVPNELFIVGIPFSLCLPFWPCLRFLPVFFCVFVVFGLLCFVFVLPIHFRTRLQVIDCSRLQYYGLYYYHRLLRTYSLLNDTWQD